MSVVGILQDETDPMVSVMKVRRQCLISCVASLRFLGGWHADDWPYTMPRNLHATGSGAQPRWQEYSMSCHEVRLTVGNAVVRTVGCLTAAIPCMFVALSFLTTLCIRCGWCTHLRVLVVVGNTHTYPAHPPTLFLDLLNHVHCDVFMWSWLVYVAPPG
jgi:hypothetical protein